MRNQKEARNIHWIMFAAAVFIIGKLVYGVVMVAVKRGIEHPVAFQIEKYSELGRIPFADMPPGAKWLLLVGYAIVVVSLIVVTVGVAGMGRQIGRAAIFSKGSMRMFQLIMSGILGYFLGEFIANMGANYLAAKFDAQGWFQFNSSASFQLLLIALFLLCMSFLSFGVRQGIRLQEDQAGLV